MRKMGFEETYDVSLPSIISMEAGRAAIQESMTIVACSVDDAEQQQEIKRQPLSLLFCPVPEIWAIIFRRIIRFPGPEVEAWPQLSLPLVVDDRQRHVEGSRPLLRSGLMTRSPAIRD